MHFTVTKEKHRFFLFLPVIVIPFCCLFFHVLGGGKGIVNRKAAAAFGLNTHLPGISLNRTNSFQNKLKTYEQADNDSAKKVQYQREEAYRKDSFSGADRRPVPVKLSATAVPADDRARQVEQQLARLRESLRGPAPAFPTARPHAVQSAMVAEERAPDPQLDRLNAMLDKVIRIQHPEERLLAGSSAVTGGGIPMDEVAPADSGVNSIAAVVPTGQILTTGTTIQLRLLDAIRVSGRVVPAGELIYGTVTINNDRLLVHVKSLREDRNLYAVEWEVYDLDGLAGIHIPGLLERDVAKQSADQGVNSLNVMTLDPSLGAQAAGASIQAAKTFLGRKVRQVRVTVRAGYQVLLRNPRAVDRRGGVAPPRSVTAGPSPEPPEWDGSAPELERSRREGMEVSLRTICIHDSCLWFGLEWRNRSPIGYRPAYVRWTIRDRRSFRRTAVQERVLEPVVPTALRPVEGDSTLNEFTAFHPFAVSKDKQLVVEIGEKDGGRTLELIIPYREILKAKRDAATRQ